MSMRISACTDKAFSEGLLPMAHLTSSSAYAVNDNATRPHIPLKTRLHWRCAACFAREASR